MATFFFRVFAAASEVALGAPLQEGVITVADTSNESAVIVGGEGRKRHRIRIFTDTACFVTWGLNPNAQNDGSDGMPMAAESPEYIDVEAGMQLSVIERA